MKFTIRYDGELHSTNGGSYNDRTKRLPEIWNIRRAVHSQLALLWTRPILQHCVRMNEFRARLIKGHPVIPLVNADAILFAHVDIQMLREDNAGNIVDNKGDLDNRLKTLLDGLRGPVENDKGVLPTDLPSPLYCLLEDDYLISEISIKTAPLLIPPQGPTADPKAWVNVVVNVEIVNSINGGPGI